MESDDCLCFSNQELAKIFKLKVEQMEVFKQLYIKNQERVVSVPNSTVNDLMLPTFALKLKRKIVQRLKQGQSALENDIQRQQFEIISFNLERKAKKLEEGMLKFSLAHMQGENGPKRLKFHVWQELISQLRQLSNTRLNNTELVGQLKSIRNRYFMKQKTVLQAYRLLASSKQSRFIQQKLKTHNRVMQLYEYFKIKYPKMRLSAIGQLIRKQTGINATQYLKQFCQADLQKLTLQQQFLYFHFTLKFIRLMINRGDQVLFIDRIQFFERQFVYYNLLNGNNNLEYKWNVFGNKEEVIFQLILGISTAGIKFYSITKEQMTPSIYLKRVLRYLIQLDKQLPKAVVLYFYICPNQRQTAVIIEIATFLQKMGVKIFILPRYRRLPNLSKAVLTFIKLQALKNISEHVCQPNFSDILKNFVKKYLKIMMSKPDIKMLAAIEFDPSFIQS